MRKCIRKLAHCLQLCILLAVLTMLFGTAVDPDKKLLDYFSAFQLSADMIRDGIRMVVDTEAAGQYLQETLAKVNAAAGAWTGCVQTVIYGIKCCKFP